MSTAIRTGLLNLARKIGRWVLEHLLSRGLSMLLGYMGGKVGEFERRFARARTPRRKAWLRGRIRRWRTAIAWLVDNTHDMEHCAGSEIDALINGDAKDIPMDCERLVAA